MSHPGLELGVNRDGIVQHGVVQRRTFLQQASAGAVGVGLSAGSVRQWLQLQAEELQRRGQAMILLWMDGGPSQFETFNPKLGSANQGPATAIQTRIPGVQFAEFFPQTAAASDQFSLIRSMTSKEAEHDRAIALVRTGYSPNISVRYPTWGSVVAKHRYEADFELPAFVRIGTPRIKTRDVDAGVFGVRYASFNIDEAGQLPDNVIPPVPSEVLRRRLALSEKIDGEFAKVGGAAAVREKQEIYQRTSRFVLSPRLNVFDLEQESAAMRDAYGRHSFGQGCLLARRLVEQGVSFVEVLSTGKRNDAGWDTHNNGFRDTPYLAAEVDATYPMLLRDLKERGLLEKTLVVWMGEFGRTPKIKADGGRDHYAKGWVTLLAGAGVNGGRVIGATDKDGLDVTERPVTIPDLFVTFSHVLGINPREEYTTPLERPIKLVEGGEVIKELFA